MNKSLPSDAAGQFAAWTALAGALLAWFNIYCYLTAVGGDMQAMFRPAVALSLSPRAQRWFLLSMLADSFGFYLAFLVTGGYLWSRLRERARALLDIATLSLVVYVVLGLAGTAMQIATLPALAAAHAGGDALVRASTEAAWLAVVHGTERGLWWMEGPVFACWGLIVGATLRAERWGAGLLLMVCAAIYGVLFLLGYLGAGEAADLLELGVLVLLPLWLAMLGLTLLRRRARG